MRTTTQNMAPLHDFGLVQASSYVEWLRILRYDEMELREGLRFPVVPCHLESPQLG
jgi:hypothetical protein